MLIIFDQVISFNSHKKTQKNRPKGQPFFTNVNGFGLLQFPTIRMPQQVSKNSTLPVQNSAAQLVTGTRKKHFSNLHIAALGISVLKMSQK